MAEKYLPLYRKYRPSSFDEVVGQEVVVKTLKNAIEHDRVAHAYLFCGPRGTGKTSIARIFAKTLNCQNPTNGIPCGKCPHCLDMNNNVSMDVIEIDAASNRKVEDARNLLEKVQFTPVLGNNKIYIIDEVHMLTTEAFNTLLKTLEEPPENLIFILATTEAHKVLETIVSRCQKFDFRRISVDNIKNRLKEISEKESINIDDDAIEFIARKSAGGLRDALALLDQSTVLALDNKAITKKDIITLLGSVDDNDLYNLAELIATKNPQEVISLLKSIIEKGNDPNQIVKELIGYFRNLMLACVCKTEEEASKLLDISTENCERILAQAKEFSAQELVQIIEKLSENEKNVRNSSNPYLWLDVAIINATTRENIIAEKAILDRIEALENQLKSGFAAKAITSVKQAEQPHIKPEIQIINIEPKTQIQEQKTAIEPIKPEVQTIKQEEKTVEIKKEEPATVAENKKAETTNNNGALIELNWDTFLGELSPTVFALAKVHARPITLNSEKIELAFKNEIFIEKIKQKQFQLEEVAKKLCGTKPKMIFRKLNDEDYKKKPLIPNAEPAVQAAKQHIQTAKKEDVKISEDEIKEVSQDYQENSKNNDMARIDLTDEAKQVLDIFAGKIIE